MFFLTADKNKIQVLLVPASLHSKTLQLRVEQERSAASGFDAWSLDDFIILAYEKEQGIKCLEPSNQALVEARKTTSGDFHVVQRGGHHITLRF